MKLEPLSQKFFLEDSFTLAPKLLGHFLVREVEGKRMVGKIVEVEAYHQSEAACHAFKGKTASNSGLFNTGGHAYVYLIYGMYWMLNIATGRKDCGEGILIRAVEPIAGVDLMLTNRKVKSLKLVTKGPGRVGQAFAISSELQGDSVFNKGGLWVAKGESVKENNIVAGPRVGIDYAGEAATLPWRFYIKDNPHIS